MLKRSFMVSSKVWEKVIVIEFYRDIEYMNNKLFISPQTWYLFITENIYDRNI